MGKPPDISARLKLHVEATQKVLDMIERCHALQREGKTAQARKLLAEIERVNASLIALELRHRSAQ